MLTSSFDTVALDETKNALVIVDQTLLPNQVTFLSLTKPEEIHAAIKQLQVRGAPAIGVAAGIGLYLSVRESQAKIYDAFYAEFLSAKAYLSTARPTAVNLFWALDRMDAVVKDHATCSIEEIKSLLLNEAKKIYTEDIAVCQAIGKHGFSLIHDGDGVLTHCNAGKLACVRYGTALAPIYFANERGYRLKVYADETRPLLQGARLTAFELSSQNIDTTLICDNMAAQIMKEGRVQSVFVGCDRVAANGDFCNKIGTLGVAILAAHFGIPFYVCAPTSTIDMSMRDGSMIPIEQRAVNEITEMWYAERMAPRNIHAYNPAFDCTPHALVTAFVTEHGIIRPPYNEQFLRLLANPL